MSSPIRTRNFFSPTKKFSACKMACPVPSCSVWNAYASFILPYLLPNFVIISSLPKPTTITASSISFAFWSCCRLYSRIGVFATGSITFDLLTVSGCSLVDFPAASMTAFMFKLRFLFLPLLLFPQQVSLSRARLFLQALCAACFAFLNILSATCLLWQAVAFQLQRLLPRLMGAC